MKKNIDAKTQTYIDKALLTLNTWFGKQQPQNQVQTPTTTLPKPSKPEETKKTNTGLILGVGLGLLAVTGLTIYLVKRAKK
jgi:hypothetical protein